LVVGSWPPEIARDIGAPVSADFKGMTGGGVDAPRPYVDEATSRP
jgi:hypothetical protein